jgi:ApaG protein
VYPMNTITTEGVKISVIPHFRSDLSCVNENYFFFNYRIRMQNNNDFTVQLLDRDWYIFDALDENKIIRGKGVVGEQPILLPGQHYIYSSGCELSSEMGQMKGFYTFQNTLTLEKFRVLIPTFQLIFPGKLN